MLIYAQRGIFPNVLIRYYRRSALIVVRHNRNDFKPLAKMPVFGMKKSGGIRVSAKGKALWVAEKITCAEAGM
jgi:hypothetical protein